MPLLADLNAITLTPATKAAAIARGADITVLVDQAKLNIIELRTLMVEIVKLCPSGDANLAALSGVLAALG